MNPPDAIDRPLTEQERSVLLRAAVELVADAMHVSFERAAGALDDCAGKYDVSFKVGPYAASVCVDGDEFIAVSRERLALAALDKQVADSDEDDPES